MIKNLFLNWLRKINIKYILLLKNLEIKDLKKILSEKIKNIKVLEFNSYEKIPLSSKSSFWILPQLSASNSPNYLINYDLDTSCIFKNKDVSIFNQVDNPYSIQDINKLKMAFKIIYLIILMSHSYLIVQLQHILKILLIGIKLKKI